MGITYGSTKDGSVWTGDMAWSSAKNIDTSVSCSVRCSLWIGMYHSPYQGAACFNEYRVYLQYVTKHAFFSNYELWRLKVSSSLSLVHVYWQVEYVASIKNYSIVFLFLVINFF